MVQLVGIQGLFTTGYCGPSEAFYTTGSHNYPTKEVAENKRMFYSNKKTHTKTKYSLRIFLNVLCLNDILLKFCTLTI